jgi:type 1 glutamine amidotransferase
VNAIAAVALVAMGTPAATAEQAEKSREPRKLKVVLWTGGGAHDYKAISQILCEDLPRIGPLEIHAVQDGKFLDERDQRPFDAILMNHCFGKRAGVLTPAQQVKLLSTIREGTGVAAVHCSYWSFGEWKDFREVFGATFIRHGRNAKIIVRFVDRQHPISRALPETIDLSCELYQSTPLAKDCHVLAVAKHAGTEAEHPSVWTKSYGKGRVVTILPAHPVDSFRVPDFQKLIVRGLLWSAGRLDAVEAERVK